MTKHQPTFAFCYFANPSLCRISRTVSVASKESTTASPGSVFWPLATRGTAFGPLAPLLPFGIYRCKDIWKEKKHKAELLIIRIGDRQGIMKGITIPSHSDILHSLASVESPEHWSLPPKSAPLQALALSCDPWPQETLHWDHWPQSCHSASTTAV